MPRKPGLGKKISNTRRNFAKREFRQIIHVDSTGTFHIPLPDFATKALGIEKVSADTRIKVEHKLLLIEDQYIKTLTDKTKVIVYQVQVRAFILNEAGDKCIFRQEEISFAKGTGLVMDYTVCYRHVRTDTNEVSYHDEDGDYVSSHRMEHDKNWIPWTQISEDFFKEAEIHLQFMAKNVWEFLHQEPKLLEQKIIEASGLLGFTPTEGPD